MALPLAKLVYHGKCLTPIKSFRLIEFCFVFTIRQLGNSLKISACVLPSTRRFQERRNPWHSSYYSADLMCRLALAFLLGSLETSRVQAQAKDQPNPPASPECRVAAMDYKGWHAQQLANRWVQLIVVPQNGGRLMQVTFAGHPYLFVNPKFAGKYLPPTSGQWFNYGGDKIWLLPEGNNDEQHWAGGSDVLDDGPFSFRKLSEGRAVRDRAYGSSRSPNWGSVCAHHSPRCRLPAHPVPRFHEERNRAYHRMVDAVGLAIRYR